MPETSRLDAAGHVLLLARLLSEAAADSGHVRRRVEALADRLGFVAQPIGIERLLLMLANAPPSRKVPAIGINGLVRGRVVPAPTFRQVGLPLICPYVTNA